MRHLSAKHYRHSAAYLLVLTAYMLVFPAHVSAVPIAEYQQNLKNAIAALQTLAESDEDESTANFQARYKQTIEGVGITLLPNHSVEADGVVCNVDHSWLHQELDKLSEEDDPFERLDQVILRLQAIEERVAERQEAGRPTDNKEWAKGRLESILARPEYATGARGPNALSRIIRDFLEWLQKFFPKRTASSAPPWLNLVARVGVVALGLLVLFFVIKILLNRFKRTGKIKVRKKPEARIVLGERLEPEQTAVDLLSEAEALARRGDLRAAIRKAYIALLVELGDRKLISLAQHKTNRDYLNSLRNAPQLHSRMRGLTDSFERHWYGFARATENDWQDFRNGYLSALQTGN